MTNMKIVQISDIHCGSSMFDENLMKNTITQVNQIDPDVLILTGDLTMDGYHEEYRKAVSYIRKFKVKKKLIVPGNHDSRNVGWKLFEKMIGNPFKIIRMNKDIIICGADSTEPDLDDGQMGRYHTNKFRKIFAEDFRFKILAMHHHVISVPNSGREMNILRDAGDVLQMLVRSRVNLVLSGHKHMPHLWHFEGIKILTSTTTTTRRIRGMYPPSYNIITVGQHLKIERKEVLGKKLMLYNGAF
ncbi:MAG: metallophosphoesterase [Spirochaetes bacterium]|nr:metallophosphoesterase [Spirochaetota bacterium]